MHPSSIHVEFDLACLWPGRAETAVSNDSSQIREVNVADGAVVGSAIVEKIAEGLSPADVCAFVKSLADGAHSA